MAQEVGNGAPGNGNTKAVVFSSLKPQLCFEAGKANDAISFYKKAFGAEELTRALHPKRKAEQELPLILSAELKIGGSVFIVCDQSEECAKANGYSFCLETENVEAAVLEAVNAGAVLDGEIPEDEAGGCCGVRTGKLKDPFGNVWKICDATKQCAEVEA